MYTKLVNQSFTVMESLTYVTFFFDVIRLSKCYNLQHQVSMMLLSVPGMLHST